MARKIAQVLAVIALIPLLHGCPAPVYELDRRQASSPLPQAAPLQVAGTFVHQGSGTTFPAELGVFRRVALLRYDTAGLDVSAGYNAADPDCPVRLTIYLSPAPRMN